MASKKTYSAAEAKERLSKLPPDIQSLIYSADMTNALQRIGQKHSLHIDQVGDLEIETSAAMLGFTEPQDFPGILAERLGLAPTEAEAVARDIDTELLQKIRDSLKKMTGYNDVPIAPPPSVPPAAVPQQMAPKAPELHPATQSLTTPTVTLPIKVPVGMGAVPAANAAPVPISAPTPATSKKYSVDPYREPVS